MFWDPIGEQMVAMKDFQMDSDLSNASNHTVIEGGGGGGIESVVAGDGIEVDATDPANPVVNLGFKSYVIAVTQTGTGELTVATEFQNTIGEITITRNGLGWFFIDSVGLFTVNKTWLPNCDGFGYASHPISFDDVNAEFYAFKIVSANRIDLQFFNSSYQNVDPSTIFGDGFRLTLPEIRVYP